MKQDMIEFQEIVKHNVSKALQKSPLIIKRNEKIPTNIDSEDHESCQLPSPIIPQVRLIHQILQCKNIAC